VSVLQQEVRWWIDKWEQVFHVAMLHHFEPSKKRFIHLSSFFFKVLTLLYCFTFWQEEEIYPFSECGMKENHQSRTLNKRTMQFKRNSRSWKYNSSARDVNSSSGWRHRFKIKNMSLSWKKSFQKRKPKSRFWFVLVDMLSTEFQRIRFHSNLNDHSIQWPDK
jgi:hypothetical protein